MALAANHRMPTELDRSLQKLVAMSRSGEPSAIKSFHDQGRIVSAEAETVGQNSPHGRRSRFVWHVVQITIRVRLIQIDRRGQALMLQRFNTSDEFYGTAGAQQMSELAL